MSNITFGKAKNQDALRISVLLKTVYIQTYGAEGITFESANFITKRFAEEYIEKIIIEDPDRLIIAYSSGNPIGVADINYKGVCSIRKNPIPELDKLYVLNNFYGKGIGYKLLKEAEKEVVKKGFQQFQLEVYNKNQRAIAFYVRQGYEKIGEVDFPMESNTYLNFVMNKILI